MKAITIIQPWATLIAIGAKQYETRSWPTKHRGPIAIHAGKKDPQTVMKSMPHGVQTSMFDSLYNRLSITSGALRQLPLGAIVATANLTECYRVHVDHTGDIVLMLGGVPKVWIGKDSPEALYGHYEDGRYAWEMTDVQRLKNPITAKGQQGLWNWDNGE